MIDVLLVLLIIFMAVLPSMRKAIDIQLPDPNPTVQPANSNVEPDRARGRPGREVRHQQRSRSRAIDLPTRLKEIYDPRPEKIIFVKGDAGREVRRHHRRDGRRARRRREGHRCSAEGHAGRQWRAGPGGEVTHAEKGTKVAGGAIRLRPRLFSGVARTLPGSLVV